MDRGERKDRGRGRPARCVINDDVSKFCFGRMEGARNHVGATRVDRKGRTKGPSHNVAPKNYPLFSLFSCRRL